MSFLPALWRSPSRSATSGCCSSSLGAATERTEALRRPPAHPRLCAEPRRLLHVLDLLRLGRDRLRARPRFPADLHRPHPRRRLRLPPDRTHREAGARAEPHHGRRLRFRALRQVARRGCDRGADRADGLGALCRAAAQGDHRDHPDGARLVRQRPADARAAAAPVLAHRRRAAGAVRDGVRHKADQPDRAPAGPYPRHRRRIAGQARRVPRRRHLRGLGPLPWPRRDFHARPQRAHRQAVLSTPPDPVNWIVTTLLAASAILLLPRQFHVSIVECKDQRDIRAAATLFRSIWC